MRERFGAGPLVILTAVAGAFFAALPGLGIGPDTSADAHDHLERRYGNIGLGLTVMWLMLMAVIFVTGVAMTVTGIVRRSRRARRADVR